MGKYFVYILKSNRGFFYIGQTNNLENRLRRHNSQQSTYTRNKGTWEIIISKEVISRQEAVNLETKLKNMKNTLKAIEYLKKIS